MELKSLGYKTDLIFTSLDGEILNRGSHLVIKTLSNPNYFWGNLVIFESAPKRGDLFHWKALFKSEFTDPAIYHMTFAWDKEEIGEIEEFLKEGFSLEKALVLTATRKDICLPLKHHPNVQIRPLKSESEWEETLQIQIACGGGALSKYEWEKFYRSQGSRYQKLIATGKGQWFCAVLESRIVGGLGIFQDGDMGRFQIVSVHPKYQRQGICGSLVYESAKYAFEKMQISKLVMVADEEYHAAKVYESVGFRQTEKIYGVCKADIEPFQF
jgi:ribosomal protein S18 acetylase RimI-like enzyme